jgi:hypothetical protein
MTTSTIKARISKIEAVRPERANHITRIRRLIIDPTGKPTGEIVERDLPR